MFTTLTRRSGRLLIAPAAMTAGVLLTLTACSSAPPASAARAQPVVALATSSTAVKPSTSPSSAETDPPAVPLGPFATRSDAKELFVALVLNYCAPVYTGGGTTSAPADPRKASVRQGPTKTEWLVKDANGDTVVINTASKRIYSTDGPDGMLPGDYTFGCDSTVFPGTWD